MAQTEMPLEQQLIILEILANKSLSLWNLPHGSVARLLNVSENTTYLVEAPNGYKAILRIHRKNYHSYSAIESELRWLKSLAKKGLVPTPNYYIGRNGKPIQKAVMEGLKTPRFLVLFEFLEGTAPDGNGDMANEFEELGSIAAKCHNHVLSWEKPKDFDRITWDWQSIFGKFPIWGDWRDAPEVDEKIRPILEKVETKIGQRLSEFGKSNERFNLIHADMRLANLLVGHDQTRLIDFDDCGWGWFMYDFAASISFIEDDPRVPTLKAAWLRGYRSERNLSAQEEAEIDTFVMLRRMALLAWIGSHIEAPEPQHLAPGFASKTAQLGDIWMYNLVKQNN